jgi:hypothetical protein
MNRMDLLRGWVGSFGTRRAIEEGGVVRMVEGRMRHRARLLAKHCVWCLAWVLSSIEIYHSYKAYFIYLNWRI